MAFFSKKRKGVVSASEKVADVYVVTTRIISSYNDQSGGGPRCVNMFFLAKCYEGEYYELFSGKKLEHEKPPKDGCLTQMFDTPYIKKIEKLRDYLKNPREFRIDTQALFDFITNMNVMLTLGAFSGE